VAGITRPDGLYWRSNGCPASLTSAFLRRHCLLRCSHDRAATAVVDASGGLSSVPVAAYPSKEDDDVIAAPVPTRTVHEDDNATILRSHKKPPGRRNDVLCCLARPGCYCRMRVVDDNTAGPPTNSSYTPYLYQVLVATFKYLPVQRYSAVFKSPRHTLGLQQCCTRSTCVVLQVLK
jgi:hypothetical protein